MTSSIPNFAERSPFDSRPLLCAQYPTPVALPLSGRSTAVAIAAGRDLSCVLLADGGVECWGRAGPTVTVKDGVIEQGATGAIGGLRPAVAISAGAAYACALHQDTTLSCWGDNWRGKLGDGAVVGDVEKRAPVAVVGLGGLGVLRGAVAISCGYSHACALLDDGTAVCWGRNSRGQLGIDTEDEDDHATPTLVRTADGGVFAGLRSISCGDQITCAVREDGTVWCWGYAKFGAVGSDGDNVLTPVRQVGGGLRVDVGSLR